MKKEVVKEKKLSDKAKELLMALRSNEGSFLRKHILQSGETAWKLLDKNFNPVSIWTDNKVQECIYTQYMKRNETGLWCFNGKPTQEII